MSELASYLYGIYISAELETISDHCTIANQLSIKKKTSMASTPEKPEENSSKESGWSWFNSFRYDKNRDTPGDTRNVLLVVAALIAAVTFQAGVNPPGGVWQETKKDKQGRVYQIAGRAIYASDKGPYYVFLISNTLALSTSIFIIVLLTHGFPFHFEVMVATLSMIVTYGSAVFAVTPHESVKFRFILFTAPLPYVIRFLYQLCCKYKHRVPRLRSCQNPCSGCA